MALVTAVTFGLNPITLKLGFQRGGRPDVAMVIGLVITVPVYLAIVPFTSGLHLEQVTMPALVGFILGGLFGTGIGRRWMYIAIDRIGASPATAIKNAAPVVTTVLSAIMFSEAVTPLKALAVLAIVGGVTLVTWRPGQGIGHWRDYGVLAALGAALSYGIRPLFLKFGLDSANLPLTGALIGAIAALAYALLLADRKDLRLWSDDKALGIFLVSGILQAFGFLALTYGISGGDVSVVYPITSSAPVFTLIFTALFLRGTERLSWQVVAGAIAVVAGVIAL